VPGPLSDDLIISSDDSDDDKVSGIPNTCLCNLTFLPPGKIRASSENPGLPIFFQIIFLRP
jgi:hypothetical protein